MLRKAAVLGLFLDAGEGVEVALVGVGEGVEVFLGGLDLGVAHAVHDGLEVGAAGEEPGGVGVAEVVDADVEVDAGGLDGGLPDAGAEGVAGDGGADPGTPAQLKQLHGIGDPLHTRLDPDGQLTGLYDPDSE